MVTDVDTSDERLRGIKRAAWLWLLRGAQVSSPLGRARQPAQRFTSHCVTHPAPLLPCFQTVQKQNGQCNRFAVLL